MDATAWPAPSKALMTFLDVIEYSSQMTRADIVAEANPSSSNQVLFAENVPPTESAAPAAMDAPNNTPVDGPPLVLFSSTSTVMPNRQAGAAAPAAVGDDNDLLKPGLVVVLPATTTPTPTTPVVETTTTAPASAAK
ncbi:hypothetical protein OOU_Y34scaffold00748g18 [Pyricularia oryzae Y34]|nr:hypothetical protein OOU_Y34scaffold00748g18 [Pyricularia oryzae Y34]